MPDTLDVNALDEKPAGSEPALPEETKPSRKRRKRSLKIDHEAVATSVIERLDKGLIARFDFMQIRLDRYAKLRGWLPTKNWPFVDCSNFWVPVIATASLRIRAALYNATIGMRPTIISKARQRQNQKKQDRIDRLLDYQVYVEASGESRFDDFITNFVDDFCAIAKVSWVRDEQNYHQIKVLPEGQSGIPQELQSLLALRELFPSDAVAIPKGKDYDHWEVTYQEGSKEKVALVEFYDRNDGKLEACITSKQTVYDGPIIEVEDLEDIVFPLRCANLQPQSASNPRGAAWVFRLCTTTMDQIRRRKKDGVYDLLTAEDLQAISTTKRSTATGATLREEDKAKQQKDELEGMQAVQYPNRDDDVVDLVEAYDRWDVDGDGLEEDVIFTIARESKKLMRARLLSEVHPGLPIMRPFAHKSFIGVPNRVLGISLPEILESIQDMTKIIMDQNIDYGTIRNAPMFFYRAMSGMKPEVIRFTPGEGYPLDNPQQDVNITQWGNSDNSWFFQMIAVLQGCGERLTMIGDIQLGRIPQGKSSALRTAGTTMALMQQGDVRGEQILRRLLHGVSQIYAIVHRLNQHFLPDDKEFRVIGMPNPGEEEYQSASIKDINAEVDFDFKATLLNTNRQALRQTLTEAMQVIMSPLAVQMGLLSQEKAYNLLEDYVKAGDLDPQRYVTKTSPEVDQPRILAEEAISTILSGEMPQGLPLETPEEHYQKLLAFQQQETERSQSGERPFLSTPQQIAAFHAWLIQILQVARQQQQKQQMIQAAAQFQQGGQPPGAQAGGGGMPGPQMGDQGPQNNGAAQQEMAMGEMNA
ncbi:MAG: hypothetical protein U1E51_31880 [Candidatus Binatia bacterium]|nr:hypothetical protein [Candidatus Binatia bacterium]